jgi:hypothetical protein
VAPVVVGVLSVLAALIAAAAGTTLLFPGGPLDVIWMIRSDDVHQQMLALGWPVGAGLWLVAAVGVATAVGSFAAMRWAWWLAVVALAVNGLSDLGRLALGGILEGVLGAVIAGVLLFVLTRPGVRSQFRR